MSTYRGKRQLTAFQTNREHDPLAEPLRWLELERLWRDVYSKDPRPAIAALTEPRAARSGSGSGDGVSDVRRAIEAIICVLAAHLQDAAAQSSPRIAARSFSYASLLDRTGQVYCEALRCATSGGGREPARGDADLGGSSDGDAERRLNRAATKLIQNALLGLVTDGRIELIDAEADVYAPFDPEVQLLPAVRRHILRAAERPGGSITFAQLCDDLAKNEGRAFTVSPSTLRGAIETLLERSVIYEVGADSFRAVS
jgi:hypothetical protein